MAGKIIAQVFALVMRWLLWRRRIFYWEKGFLKSNLAMVALCDDVKEVLTRDDVFEVAYSVNMRAVGGGHDFLLGMTDTCAYRKDMENLGHVVRREDAGELILKKLDAEAEHVLTSGRTALDIKQEYTVHILATVFQSYFGLDTASTRDLGNWAGQFFEYSFAGSAQDAMGFHDAKLEQSSLAAAETARATALEALERRIAQVELQRKGPGYDLEKSLSADKDLLTRLARLHCEALPRVDDKRNIVAMYMGMLSGYILPTGKVAAEAIDYLLDFPQALGGAQDAARRMQDSDPQRAKIASQDLLKYIFEAARWRPLAPSLVRKANRAYTIADNTPRARTVAKDTLVLVGIQAAMFDEQYVDDPAAFMHNRPLGVYLHEGYGLHTCFGKHLNPLQIPVLVAPLLRRKGLRRCKPPGDAATPVAGVLSPVYVSFEP